jgi:hypothetical protein
VEDPTRFFVGADFSLLLTADVSLFLLRSAALGRERCQPQAHKVHTVQFRRLSCSSGGLQQRGSHSTLRISSPPFILSARLFFSIHGDIPLYLCTTMRGVSANKHPRTCGLDTYRRRSSKMLIRVDFPTFALSCRRVVYVSAGATGSLRS